MARGGQARAVPGKTTLIKDIQLLATLDADLGDVSDAAIFIEGNVIKWVGSARNVPQEYSRADNTISLPNRVVIPGLVNTHHHMFQCLTRCIAQVRYVIAFVGLFGHSCETHKTCKMTYAAAG